ncbi:3-oxoacyl-[acyl-carrier-protein] reductase FabG [Trichoplax sp. H2]|nr:3-oxoacyl-[acyl-carrier-protein] reductase FabG [Trichoplax sp. H2]|eukprot:RDD37239.1 3-oxoacyl-[acyl-carrier-protein] reductase FabG [Trichoplax sp. H2]
MASVAHKVALITGASSGIGATTCRFFAREGYKLVLAGRNLDSLQSVAQCCGKVEKLIISSDLTDVNEPSKIIEKSVSHFGRLDVLVNNAAILALGSIEESDLEQYDNIMDTNIRSMYQLTQKAVPHLIKTQGSVVNVSSINGLRSFPGALTYSISKSAVDQFTRCIALELASKQVRVNCVNPGIVDTNIRKRGNVSEEVAEFLERSKTTHALGRIGTTEEIADAILFLASDRASFITGVTLPVDGGKHAMCPY